MREKTLRECSEGGDSKCKGKGPGRLAGRSGERWHSGKEQGGHELWMLAVNLQVQVGSLGFSLNAIGAIGADHSPGVTASEERFAL